MSTKMHHYQYHINIDERGEFSASVYSLDSHGDWIKEVACIDGIDAQIFEYGFMRHKRDLVGLRNYLINIKIIPENSTLK